MNDTHQLLLKLEAYQRSLLHHLSIMGQAFQEVDKQWRALSAIYEGQAANEFRAHWQQSAAMFQEYLDQSTKIIHFLNERIAALRRADQPGDILP